MRTPTALSCLALILALGTGCAAGGGGLAVVITGPLEEPNGALRVEGPAADEGLICPAVTFEGRDYEDLDGNELTLEDLEHLPDDSSDVRWFDSFSCTDGSGTFVMVHEQLLSRGEVDFEGYNEVASWEISEGTGDYATLSGSGRFILDFVEGVVVNSGSISVG